ncbi:MAG TPA: serine/threonine-protein kinase [Noviherbaspirillum sp.]|jgi:predicted Ser/Thr protein kinase|uniref:serine/threonine-protein kinase n=1 Tax=Noviherbaspirillum sp. TaxID=1926288 RepID=UPI002F926E10
MAPLAHTLHRFHSGGLTQEQLLAQVDAMLASDRTGIAQLTEVLNEEHTRTLLPPEVVDALKARATPDMAGAAGVAGQAQPAPTTPSVTGSTPPLPLPEAAQTMKGVGDTLNGRFVLEECVGFGGMGMVYKALDLRKLEASDRKPYIAIKVLNVQFRGHPKSLIALQREAKKAQTLAHPNIVAVYDFDRDGSTVYLTMEYLAGKSLSQVLRNPEFHGMPYAEAMHIVAGMGRALAYAHERGFVHCDFKPANVIITDRGEVKVIDFGIARAIHKPTEEAEATVFDAGSLGGLTPAYASAEMLEHREPDPRDDVYALACITYELLTGRHPFDRMTAAEARNAGRKPQRPKDIGHGQWRALRNALAFRREARTPGVQRFLHEMGMERSGARPVVIVGATTLAAALASAGIAYWWASSQLQDRALPAQAGAGAPAVVSPAAPKAAPALDLAGAERLLARVPCAALMPRMEGTALRVEGFLPASYGSGRLRQALAGARELRLDVQEVGDDKCRVINLLAPYWKQNRQDGGKTAIHTRPRDARLQEGDALVLDLTTPAYDSFAYVDYHSFDGGTLHLLPGPRTRAHQAPPNHAATLGSFGNWVISKPFGTDLIVLMVTPAPLFDGLRPESEKSADYLAALERQLQRLGEKHGRERIMVDFLQVTTSARKQ